MTVLKFTMCSIILLCSTITLSSCDKGESAQEPNRSADAKSEKVERYGPVKKTVADIDDSVVSANVKAAIEAGSRSKAEGIMVETLGGATTLQGSVNSPEDKKQLGVLASGVEGVKSIDNQLIIKSKD